MTGVYTLPHGVPVLRCVVHTLHQAYEAEPEKMADTTIILPTRRAVRDMQDLFMDLRGGRPMILPRLMAVGDVDSSDLDLWLAATTGKVSHLPPAIDPWERLWTLAQMVKARDPGLSTARAVAQARTLIQFMDAVQNEGLSLDRLDQLVAADYARHWQLSLDFLTIIRGAWPDYLRAAGRMDPAARRHQLLMTLADFWRDHPPLTPIWLVGVTGSLPAVAALMTVVTTLPLGRVLIPGIDRDEMWPDPVPDQHPMADIAQALGVMGVAKDQVQDWPCDEDPIYDQGFFGTYLGRDTSDYASLRATVPVATQSHWRGLRNAMTVIEADDRDHEALIVAMQVRLALANPGATVMIVTPNRTLARAIGVACGRLGVVVNDSAGEPLILTLAGQFFWALWRVIKRGFHPVDLLFMIRHPLFVATDLPPLARNALIHHVLRGPRPPAGWEALRTRVGDRLSDQPTMRENILDFLDVFQDVMTAHKQGSGTDILAAHATLAERLTTPEGGDQSLLWRGDDGQALGHWIEQLMIQDVSPLPGGDDYGVVVEDMLRHMPVHRVGVGHPRVALLGTYEARLLSADVVILPGMNEQDWPGDVPVDPWFSRAMRRDFGLPAVDRYIGRISYDFLGWVTQKKVIMTRARTFRGQDTLPSRFIKRLDLLTQALWGNVNDPKAAPERDTIMPLWARDFDRADQDCVRMTPPAPVLPLSRRPLTVWATDIERLINDPYTFYAQKILGLREVDGWAGRLDQRYRGMILHEVLEEPSSDLSVLEARLMRILGRYDPADYAMDLPRLRAILGCFITWQQTWMPQGEGHVQVEKTYKASLGPYTLKARLDRVDQDIRGDIRVIDYKIKTQLPSRKDVQEGLSPQLSLQAWLVEKASGRLVQVGLLALTPRGTDLQSWDHDTDVTIDDLIARTEEGLMNGVLPWLLDDQQAFIPGAQSLQKNLSAYDDLAGRDEWSDMMEDDDV